MKRKSGLLTRIYNIPPPLPGDWICSCVCHFNSTESVQSGIELIVHITISVLPGTHLHLSPVKHVRMKCLSQGHKHRNNVQCPNLEMGETFFYKPAPSGIANKIFSALRSSSEVSPGIIWWKRNIPRFFVLSMVLGSLNHSIDWRLSSSSSQAVNKKPDRVA